MTNDTEKLTIKERQAQQQKILRERRAALRLKLPKEEAAKRRAASLRRFKRFDLISAAVLTVVLIALSFVIYEATKPSAPNEAVLNATLLFWAAITLQSALMIRTSFVRLSADDKVSEDKTDHPFRGWKFTYFTPLIGTAILLPAILSGVYSGDGITVVGGFFLVLAMSFVSLLLGALVAAFIITPIELIIRGFIALAKGDKTKTGYLYFGFFAAALTTMIILGTMAVNPDSAYPRGSFEIVLAILGIPGGYSVESEVLLWVVRGIIIALISAYVISVNSRKDKAAPSLDK